MIQVIEPGRLQLAVLASGRGTNFEAIFNATKCGELNADIRLLVSDKESAPVLAKAKSLNINAVYINPRDFESRYAYEAHLVGLFKTYQVNVVALAGYMRLVGNTLLNAFPHCIVNIHPALLPAFPGLHAQQQAIDYGVKFSGCTLHLVDEGMDTGPIIMQAVVKVLPGDDEETLAQRIQAEEHKIYWRGLQLMAEGRVYLEGRKVIIKD
ncbi:MAG: phosphoribosylglycinamide formyltransferase [Syntrophomonadaceae bacterium]|jgi:phosphoribosylglycinamide formyltransferase-1